MLTRVLIAENDQALSGLLERAICRIIECEVTVARDAAEAKAKLATEEFDLILLDIGMYSDGLETLQEIKGRNERSEVIALTTGVIHAKVLHLLALADVFAVVTKPFDLSQLSMIVLEALRESRDAQPNQPLVYRDPGADPTLE